PCAHRTRRTAGLAVAIIESVLIDQTEDVGAFLIGSHHQLGAGRERAPERFLLVAGRIGTLEATDESVALLLGNDQRRQAAAPALDLCDSIALAGPCPDKGH